MAKILYVITELDPGGAERSLFELARNLDRREFHPTVAALTGRGVVGSWLEREGIEVAYLDAASGLGALAVLRLRRLMRRLRPDVVHSFLFHANIASRLAAAGLGIRAVIGSIRVAEVNRPWRLRIDRLTQRLTTLQTCVSEGVRRFTIEQARIPPEKLVTIHNGIDASRYEGLRGTIRQELGLRDDDPVVTTVARLDPQKGIGQLVKAASALRKAFPAAHFLIIGDGPERTAIQQAIAQSGLGDAVRLLGWRDDVPSILASSDIFVLPSLWEGMPNVVLEAMACGLPVVATSVGGCPETVDNGRTGVLVPPGDAQALAAAIASLLGDREAARRMGAAGREKVRRDFSLERMIEANVQLYRKLLGACG